jgi:hypothetical protein
MHYVVKKVFQHEMQTNRACKIDRRRENVQFTSSISSYAFSSFFVDMRTPLRHDSHNPLGICLSRCHHPPFVYPVVATHGVTPQPPCSPSTICPPTGNCSHCILRLWRRSRNATRTSSLSLASSRTSLSLSILGIVFLPQPHAGHIHRAPLPVLPHHPLHR